MTSQWISVWLSGAAVLVAAVAAVFAGISNGYVRGQRDAAVRQANAMEAQTAVMARQLELAEKAAAGLQFDGSVLPRRRVIPWSIGHARGDMYSLTNGSEETVYDVELEPPDGSIHRGPYAWERFDPRSMETFLLAFSLASPSRRVEVRWRWTPEGDVQRWSTEVPRKA